MIITHDANDDFFIHMKLNTIETIYMKNNIRVIQKNNDVVHLN